ncbi:MAG: peptidoglycan-associated lipoprotein Pal [Piscinibacter sp.]|uniref:peptidoglycan-associated lipoprotein Pal n=1 Tax=Piscinibacter sp. TaxID=1903157 RepID=UPI001B71A410|nr:peptidoglycan-associated lipoprotein Pal [Piscinibacter sp.]MBP5988701.1 peptidoglycan-associated lipoprotein Pal [Piscinibacter sp.]MBP6025810.1 peptidoglycan-associated lipoprotein Pal [Piscinibacter sp.]
MNTTSKTHLPKFALAAFAAAVLAGCSSVPLDENKGGAPVESRSTTGSGAGGASSGTAQSKVTPVDLSKTDNAALSKLQRVVFFDFDSYVVKDEFRSTIEGNAKLLSADRKKKVTIEGHTDERGGREYNLALGQKRAEAVQKSLALLGAGNDQMEAVSFGKERPAVQGSDEAAWAKNRRAELVYR